MKILIYVFLISILKTQIQQELFQDKLVEITDDDTNLGSHPSKLFDGASLEEEYLSSDEMETSVKVLLNAYQPKDQNVLDVGSKIYKILEFDMNGIKKYVGY